MSKQRSIDSVLEWVYQVGQAHQRQLTAERDANIILRRDLSQANERLRAQDGDFAKLRQMLANDPVARSHMEQAGYPGFTR